MPVKKVASETIRRKTVSSTPPPVPPPMPPQHEMPRPHGWCHGKCSDHLGRKLLMTLVGILLVYGIVYVGTLIRNNMQEYYFIGKADRMERTILVEAQGKVSVVPNVATLSMGMTSEAKTVNEAQTSNSEKMNALISRLKDLGIASEDIQTSNYNVYPQYEYNEEGTRSLAGYTVSQRVQVRIRDVAKADQVVALAGELEINEVGELTYSVDERQVYVAQAREEALKEITEKANQLTQSLGVRVVNVYAYNEYEEQSSPYMYYEKMGMGGSSASVAPNIEPGQSDVVLHVSVTFEIR